jgi:hypothetical protein
MPPGWKHAPACRNGGSAITCDDGVRNGNEAMADCGGGCTRNQAKQCAADAAKAVASLVATATAQAGKFEVLLPGNITGWGGPSTLSVRARQKLVITCVASVRPRTPPQLSALGKGERALEILRFTNSYKY